MAYILLFQFWHGITGMTIWWLNTVTLSSLGSMMCGGERRNVTTADKRRSSSALSDPLIDNEQSYMEDTDVAAERDRVEGMALPSNDAISVCQLMKKFPGRGNTPAKFAVNGVSFGIRYGETFGLLGPNGKAVCMVGI